MYLYLLAVTYNKSIKLLKLTGERVCMLKIFNRIYSLRNNMYKARGM